jgi:two-component system, NarL family, sensor histidine kinase DesK
VALQIARSLIVALVLSHGVLVLADVAQRSRGTGETVVYGLCAVILFGFQAVLPFLSYQRWESASRVSVFFFVAAATYLTVAFGGMSWNGLTGPLAGSALLLLTGVRAWGAFAVVVAVPPLRALAHDSPLLPAVGLALVSGLGGLVVLGLCRLTHLVSEAWASRAEAARSAVVSERLRFSMDLHDLLGFSLSSIALKSELIYRLVPNRPDQARKEIDEILGISRQALSDVRLVARGYRDMSLESEASSARSVLDSLGVAVRVDIRCGSLPPAVDAVLATAVREGVTNALRHACVRHITIRVADEREKVRLVVANDGVARGPAEPCRSDGTGLHNLASRFDVVGGSVDAALVDDGWFHLVCEVPLAVSLGSGRPPS